MSFRHCCARAIIVQEGFSNTVVLVLVCYLKFCIEAPFGLRASLCCQYVIFWQRCNDRHSMQLLRLCMLGRQMSPVRPCLEMAHRGMSGLPRRSNSLDPTPMAPHGVINPCKNNRISMTAYFWKDAPDHIDNLIESKGYIILLHFTIENVTREVFHFPRIYRPEAEKFFHSPTTVLVTQAYQIGMKTSCVPIPHWNHV